MLLSNRQTFAKPSDATAYTAGDLIGNSLTANLVVPLKFTMERPSGKLTGANCIVVPASGNLVITNFAFDLLIFAMQPFPDAGFPADNGVLTMTEALYNQVVGVYSFGAGAWRNHLGALTAGTIGYQAVGLSNSKPSAVFRHRSVLYGLLQVTGAWTPGAVVNNFNLGLEGEAEK